MKIPHRGAGRARSRAGCRGLATAMKEKIAPRKRAGGEFLRGTSECAAEVIVWVSVSSRKPRTSAAEDSGDLWRGRSTKEQFLGDPFIGDAPVGLWETLENPQSVQPIGIDVGRTSGGGGISQPVCGSRIAVRWRRARNVWCQRPDGMRAQTVLGVFEQGATFRSQAGLGVQDPHPRRVAAPVAA